jgi:His/Glu/Gln/Arg/opine family amino acid ABC transporter permease subunit
MNELIENFANYDSLLMIYPLLLQGIKLSFLLAIVALPLAWAAGLLIAVLYSFERRWLRGLLLVWIDLFRSFPVVVLLVLIYFGLPFFGLKLGGFTAVVLALVLNNSGYFGEIFRAGINSVPKGQREAARAHDADDHPAASHPQCARTAGEQLAGADQDHVHRLDGRFARAAALGPRGPGTDLQPHAPDRGIAGVLCAAVAAGALGGTPGTPDAGLTLVLQLGNIEPWLY